MLKPFIYALLMLTVSANNYAQIPPQTAQQYAELATCKLASGKTLEPCTVGYRTFGKLNADASNAILVPTWYTGHSAEHSYLASAKVIDPSRYFVIVVDALSNGVSTSPSNSPTQSGAAYPAITIADMVDSQYQLLTKTLAVNSLHAIVGLSMGAMQAFEWAIRYPHFSAKTVAAIGSPRLASFDVALWTTRNNLLKLNRKCQCDEALQALVGLSMLGQVPMELSNNIAAEKIAASIVKQALEAPISHLQSWDQQRQAEAMLKHNIARNFDNNLTTAAASINTKMLIIVSTDDRVVTPEPARQLAKLIDAEVLELDKNCGHADPWCDPDVFAKAVNTFLADN